MSPEELQLLAVVLLVVAGYLLPTLIAYKREHHNRHAIAAVNILLGWVLIGWIAAFVWSLTAVDRSLAERRPKTD